MINLHSALYLALSLSLPWLIVERVLAQNQPWPQGVMAVSEMAVDGNESRQSEAENGAFLWAQGQVPTPPLQPLPPEDDVEIPATPPSLDLGTETPDASPDKSRETCAFTSPEVKMSQAIPFLQVQVDGNTLTVNLVGMTAFSAAELLTLPSLQPWQTAPPSTSTPLAIAEDFTTAEFEVLYQGLIQDITQRYINGGYITSQAIAQPLESNENDGGNLLQQPILVVEGQLQSIQLQGRGRLRPAYICDRLVLGLGTPLNIGKIEENLRLLQINPMLEKVGASLLPTGRVGLSDLSVTVTEAYPFSANLSFDNYSPISLGSERGSITLDYKNVTGLGDQLTGSYYVSTTGGLDILDFNYRVPLNPTDGTLQIRIVPTWTRITQSPFDVFNITGTNPLYEISYRQPIWKSLREEFALSVGFRYQDGRTLGLNRPDLASVSRTSVFQFGQDYSLRDETGLWFFRSQMNLGTGLFDATTNPSPLPSGEFFSWLGQAQRLQRLGRDNLLILQTDLQLTPDSLLPDYLFIIGGGQSIRGYRQNARSADNGIRFSVENRITLARDGDNNSVFELAPFVDFGAVWNSAGNPTQLPPNSVLVAPVWVLSGGIFLV